MASDDTKREANPLVRTVDTLLKRSRAATDPEGVPVLTQVVESELNGRALQGVDPAAIEALAHILERAVLERLGPEVDRLVEERVAKALTKVLEQALAGLRQDLTVSVTQMVREAVAASVARALSQRDGK